MSSTLSEVFSDISDSMWWIRDIWDVVAAFYSTLLQWVRTLCTIIFIAAVLAILQSYVKAIWDQHSEWKAKPGSHLMFSYFSKTGFYRRDKIYHEAYSLVWDKRWTWFSFAGAAYKLGVYESKSKFLLFLLSLIYIPLAILGFFEMIVRDIMGTLYLLIVGIAHWLVLILLSLVNSLITPFWKGLDKAKREEQHCPHCFRTFTIPAYTCPKCGVVHTDLIPGNTGLLHARCECGQRLPASLSSGRAHLETNCPECKKGLAASNAKELTILLTGGNKSGKTAFLAGFQHVYIPAANQLSSTYVTGSPKDHFDELEQMCELGDTFESTKTDVVPYNFVHRMGGASHNMVVYDIPDEVLLEDNYELNPLNFGYADGFILIFDPFSERTVRDESAALGQNMSNSFYSYDSFEDIVISFIQQFSRIANRSSSKMIDLPVAVVISKADTYAVARKVGQQAIEKVFSANPGRFYNSYETARNSVCRNYLDKLGLANALNNLESVFSNVQYFSYSIMGGKHSKGVAPSGVIDPFLWIAKDNKSKIAMVLQSVREQKQ